MPINLSLLHSHFRLALLMPSRCLRKYLHANEASSTFLWDSVKKRLQISLSEFEKRKEIPPKFDMVKMGKISDYLSKRMNKPKRNKPQFPLFIESHLSCVLDALLTIGKLDAAWDIVLSCQQKGISLQPETIDFLLWGLLEHSNGDERDRFLRLWEFANKKKIITFEGFASKIYYHSKFSQLDEIRNTLSMMRKRGFDPQYLLKKSRFTAPQAKVVMESIAKVDPNLKQNQVLPVHIRVPPLIRHLYSKSGIQPKFSDVGSLSEIVPSEDLLMRLESHLAIERAGYLDIPSVVAEQEPAVNPIIQDLRVSKHALFQKTVETWKEELIVAVRGEQDRVLAELDLPQKRIQSKKGLALPGDSLFLCLLSAETWADIATHEVALPILAQGVGGTSLHVLVGKIGRAAWHHYVMKKRDSAGLFSQLSEIYREYMKLFTDPLLAQTLSPREYWESLMDRYANSLDVPYAMWTKRVISPLAFHLMHLFVNKLSMPRIDMEPNAKYGKPFYYQLLKGPSKKSPVIFPNQKLVRLYKVAGKLHQKTFRISAFDLPTLIPPKPWSSTRDGGLLCLPTFLVRVREEGHSLQPLRVPSAKMMGVFDSLNILGNCPWVVNKPILDEVIAIFRKGGSKELDIPLLPKVVPNLRKWSPEFTPDEFYKLKQSHQLDQKDSREAYSLYMDMIYRLSVADKIRDEVFWLPHFLDFRGRAYPMSPTLSHMGGDVQRGMIKFAIGEPLGPKGLDWLKIHLINLTGLHKKSSLQERLQAANGLLGEIVDSAERPMEGRGWWRQMEEPWQVLAVCREIRDAIISGDHENFISNIPVHQDGSCNGLQHYAALGRDPIGARSVNLSPASSPADVYAEVATHVDRFRAEDAKNGCKIAKMLEDLITRKVVKQPVMTEVYGVTLIGAREQVEQQLNELVDWPRKDVFEASMYVVHLLNKSMDEMFENAKVIQDWFARGAHLIAKHHPVEWETPLGLLCTQPYHKPYKQYLTTKLQENLKLIYRSESTRKPDGMKQRNGFPPNFIHSLDSSHMMLTALNCQREGITFMSVHDSYWTHAATVDRMGQILREQFILLHSQPILENLSSHFVSVYGDKIGKKALDFLKNIPPKGDFDISRISQSDYFFS